jgi:hypothetical protein
MIVNDKLKRMWRELWPILKYCQGICLEGLRKIRENLIEDSQYLGQISKLGSPKYEARVLIM